MTSQHMIDDLDYALATDVLDLEKKHPQMWVLRMREAVEAYIAGPNTKMPKASSPETRGRETDPTLAGGFTCHAMLPVDEGQKGDNV